MKVFKNLFGDGSKIHVDEIAVSPDFLLEREGCIRFGNGIQVCWNRQFQLDIGNGGLAGAYFTGEWFYPKTFVVSPIVLPAKRETIQSDTPLTINSYSIFMLQPGTSYTRVRVVLNENFSTSHSWVLNMQLLAISRWK